MSLGDGQGRGGFGDVYVGTFLSSKVAVKVSRVAPYFEPPYFGTMMNHLKKKERIYRLSSSDGMRRSLESPMTGRPFVLTARPSQISQYW